VAAAVTTTWYTNLYLTVYIILISIFTQYSVGHDRQKQNNVYSKSTQNTVKY